MAVARTSCQSRAMSAAVVRCDDVEFVSVRLRLQLRAAEAQRQAVHLSGRALLFQICERQVAQLMTLKNVAEIFQFACDFNFVQLRRSAKQFICQGSVWAD